jgi:putative acetyltransferase
MDDDLRFEAERPFDIEAIRAINDAAFGHGAEGAIVDMLRAAEVLTISLVARGGEHVVGHVALSPVVSPNADAKLLGLGPVAVLPVEQRRGIGSMLIRQGLEQARAMGWAGVVVLGHAEYYPRFGFVPASRFGIRCEYDVPDEAFMAIELQPAGLQNCAGLAKYHAAFALAGA